MRMNRVEEVAITVFIAIVCPASLFVLLWWSTSALVISRGLKIQEDTVIYVSLLGLGIGILLTIFYMKDIKVRFYNFGYKLLIPLYFFWSAIALAFSMGTPFGNLILGPLAGLYYGRRLYYQNTIEIDIGRSARKISAFTALVTGVESLFIGIMGLQEQIVAELIQSLLGLDRAEFAGPIGIGLVVCMVIIVMSVQYMCTTIAFRTAIKIGKRKVA
jgi:multisubunit Na+/H+ antiporter MnhC subunit